MTSALTPPPDGASARFILRGKTYTVLSPSSMTLKMLLQLEIETEQLGRKMTLADFERLEAEWAEHRRQGGFIHPAALWVVGVTVWASRRLAGEDVSFEEAIDFSLEEMKDVPSPQDHKAPSGKKAGAKQAPRKARPAKKAGSGRAAARQPAAASNSEQPPSSTPE